MSQAMQFEALRTISIVDTIKNVTPDTEAEEIKQKNQLTNLLRLAKEQSKGEAKRTLYSATLNYVSTYN